MGHTAITRRRLLATAGMAGVVTLLPSNAPETAAATSAPDPPDGAIPANTSAAQFFSDPDLNFSALIALGNAGVGAGEVGEVIATISAINVAGATYTTYVDAFLATARRIGRLADRERRAGHRASARSAALRSAAYYAQALFYVVGSSKPSREAQLYREMQRQWDLAARTADPPAVRVRIPYRRVGLPGYLFRPDDSGRKRPTVIVNNGSDGQNIEVYYYVHGALERGYNALVFEGPGQGSLLFEHHIPFRHDWEHVIHPVVDFLRSRSEVSPDAITIIGTSMAGDLVARAAAFEHRLAAVCLDPGVVDPWLAFPESLRSLFVGRTKAQVNNIWQHFALPALTERQRFLLAKRGEIFGQKFQAQAMRGQAPSDIYDLGQIVMRFRCAHVVGHIRAPTLVINYEPEQFYPGQAEQAYRLLRSPKQLRNLVAATGAGYHDAPMAPQQHNQVIFDWMDGILGRRG